MPQMEVVGQTATVNRPMGYIVRTEGQGNHYSYRFEKDEDADDDVLELVERKKNGEKVEPKITQSVREAMNERGYDVRE